MAALNETTTISASSSTSSSAAAASSVWYQGTTDGAATSNITTGITTTSSLADQFDPYEVVAFLLVHCPSAVIVDRAFTPIWYVVGIVGNVLSGRIWTQRRMRQSNSSAVYLSAISVVDLIFILLHVVMELKYAWAVHSFRAPVFCEIYYVLFMATQYLSPTLVLCFTVERYIAVCHPFRKEQFCTCVRAVKVVIGAIACCTSLALIQAYFWVYDAELTDCVLRESIQEGLDGSLWSVWSWMTEITVFLVVPVIILLFNILVILEVRKVSRLGQKNMVSASAAASAAAGAKGHGVTGADNGGSTSATTVMLLSVSFYVIVTTLPATLVYVLMLDFPEGDHNMSDDEIRGDPVWNRNLNYMLGRKIVDEICLSHYACNFILYVITGAHFRRSLLELVGCPPPASRRAGPYTEVTQKTDAVTAARTTHF